MTRHRSNRQPKRIVRIERAVEANTQGIQANLQLIQELAGLFSEMRANQAIIQQEQDGASRERLHLLGLIAQNSSEIKGLQTETKRILDLLLNQSDRNNGNS